jgi:glutaredoxin
MCWNSVSMVTVLNPSAAKFFFCCHCQYAKDTVFVTVTNIFNKLKNADLNINISLQYRFVQFIFLHVLTLTETLVQCSNNKKLTP